MAGAVCAMRKSFEAQSAALQRLMEELEGSTRETNRELRDLRLKSVDYQDLAASIAASAERNTLAVTKAVQAFEAAINRLIELVKGE